MCCCCPPAITALFYLWVRSGFSKDAVAGALVFFPPDPPLYKFKRINSKGEVMPDIDDDEAADEEEDGGGGVVEETKQEVDYDDDDDSDSDLGTFEIDTKSSHKVNNNDANNNNTNNTHQKVSAEERRKRRKQREEARQKQRQEYSQDPIAAMTDRSNKLRLRAKRRAKIDARDAQKSVTYQFVPDIATLGNLPSFHGSIQAIKIGPQKRTGSYIAALLYKLPNSEITPNTKTILYSHGNAADIGAMSGLQCMMAKNLKCNVLVYDYSGYGESGGIPMEKNTYRDVKLVYEWVVKNVTHHEHNVILYGQSVGSGPSCYLASRRSNVGGLVLHSPFTSGMRVLTPSRALACLDIFPNIDRIKKVKCPVFIIHGKKDAEVGFEHGLALQAAVPEDCQRDPWWVEHKGHNDICDGPDIVEYMQRMNRFVKSLDE
jgi:pimeloyl-ACP methyl ester carboxylesterase